MRLAILTANPGYHSTLRLAEAAQKRGHAVEVLDYLRCTMSIASHRPTLSYGGRIRDDFDAVIPRVSAASSVYGLAVVRQFEMMGVYTLNSSQAIARARDKLRSLQILSRKGLGLPVTGFAHSPKDVESVIETVGRAPLVIKLLEGAQGIGVVLAETDQAARSVIEAFRGLDVNILVQEFIREAAGADIRAFVVGEKVIAAMKRQGRPGEFRSNLHLGGEASKIKLTPEERSTALRSARALGLRMAGVDMLRSHHGPVVMEVNSSPGLEGIERTTGKDVAGAIVEFVEKNLNTPRSARIQA